MVERVEGTIERGSGGQRNSTEGWEEWQRG